MTSLSEVRNAYTGPGKFWLGDKNPVARVYFGGMYVTVEQDGDELRLNNGSARARERLQVAGALRAMETGFYVRG